VRPARCPGHCISQTFFDGRWNLLDGDMGPFYLLRDNVTIAGEKDLARDHDLLKRSHTSGVLNPDSRAADEGNAALFLSETDWPGTRDSVRNTTGSQIPSSRGGSDPGLVTITTGGQTTVGTTIRPRIGSGEGPMHLIELLLASLPVLLHGHEIHIGKDVTIQFNMYYDPNLGGKEKERASTYFVERGGMLLDGRNLPTSIDRIRTRLVNGADRTQRLQLVFSDPNRGLLPPAVLIWRILAGRDKDRPLVIYIDFLPWADK
jgi:hypothetical protein